LYAEAHQREDRRRMRERMIAARMAGADQKAFDKALRLLDD